MIPQAPKIESCLTCGAKDFPRMPSGHCSDVNGCTARRIARTKPRALKGPCIVRIKRYGHVYYLEKFAAKSQDPKFEIKPPRYYFQAVLEKSSASNFEPEEALMLAKEFNGTAVEK